MKQIQSILRKATRKEGDKLNILTCATHESAETMMCKTGHNFYSLQGQHCKVWEKKYRPLPSNYTLLPVNYIPIDLDFDIIMFQTIVGQPQILANLAYQNGIPLLRIEHTQAYPNWPRDMILQYKQFSGLENIFITDFSRKTWLYNEDESIVIGHAIDTDLFKPNNKAKKNGTCLSVVNDWVNRDEPCGFRFWQHITQGIPVTVLGNTPGLSEPAKSVDDLVKNYQECSIFVNTSLLSPMPMALLEAMACGCAIVSTETAAIPEYLVNGYNAYISNDPSMLKYYINDLLNNPEKRKKFGNNARKTVESKCSISDYIKKLNNVFNRVAAMEPMYT